MSEATDRAPAGLVLIYTTFPDLDTAKRIAARLLERRLIACANLLPGMVAVFRWEGKADAGEEVAAILKTAPARVEALREALHALHPYDLPAFAVLPASATTEAFGAWVADETAP